MHNLLVRVFPQLFFIVLGTFIIASTYLHVGNGRGLHIDPRLIPLLAAGLMVALSGVSLVATLVRSREEGGGSGDDEELDSTQKQGGYARLLAVFAGMVLWIVVTPLLGFVVTSLLLCGSMMLAFGCRDYRKVVGGSVLVVTILYLVFVALLKIPVPSSLLL